MKSQLQKIAVSCSLTLVILVAMLEQSAKCQVQNALSFVQPDDRVTVSNASSVIANSTGMTLSLWVYPANGAVAWPDYDAFAGFRDDLEADFYLVQVSSTTVECRFRNNTGTYFDITDNSLQLNTWQHYVATYDGTNLKVYYNGVLTQTVAANGVITTTAGDLLIGDQIYSVTSFPLLGKLDEVSLWDRALTASEVGCVYNGNVDTGDVNLRLYYKFNQGVAGGNNSTIAILNDEKGAINGVLSGFALNGTSSNWVGSNITSSLNISAGICTGDSYTFGSQVLTTPGVYIDTLVSSTGCDSIVSLTLTVTTIDTSVTLFSTVLHAVEDTATYQWVDCNNGYAPIPGATSRNYAVTGAGGNYAVIVTNNGCSDTSSCHSVTSAGIEENNVAGYVHVYPNPAADYLTINLDKQLRDADVQISDVEGRILWREKNNNNYRLNVSKWAAGIYIMKVTSANGTANIKLQKN